MDEEDLYCAVCGKTAYFLCGRIIGPNAATCDAPLCRDHYYHGFCRKHSQRQLKPVPLVQPSKVGAQLRLF